MSSSCSSSVRIVNKLRMKFWRSDFPTRVLSAGTFENAYYNSLGDLQTNGLAVNSWTIKGRVMAYRNKTYVCFDGDNDMKHYRLMTAWKASDHSSFNFQNAHDLNTARDTSQEESIKRQLRARFANSKCFIVLIGENTRYLRKFVKWEMEVAIKLGLPIIGVNLDDARGQTDRCPSAIRDTLAIYVPFRSKIIQHAMDNWPASHLSYIRDGKSGPYYYNESVYSSLGL